MRPLLALIALIAGALAAPANGPQFILAHGDQEREATLQEEIVKTDVHGLERGHGVIETDQTIYMYLTQETRYTKLIKLIDFDEEYVTILNATTNKITFFAPDDKALTPHRKRKHHDTALSLATVYEEYERLLIRTRDDEDEEKKKRFKKILHALLEYHTLLEALDKPAMYANATYATALKAKDGSYDGQYRRVSVGNGILGQLGINFYVGVEWKSVAAENGFIYGINHPIIPPPSILDELFLVSEFSILTSALQKVGLDDALQWRFKRASETEGGGPVVSLFAPSDWAFKRLPPRLRLFLFSPAGEKVLKKILQYHIVPHFILHSDWVHDATSDDDLTPSLSELMEEYEGDDWYADSKVSPFPKGRSKKAKKAKVKKMMRKWKKNINEVVSILLKDDIMDEANGADRPKRCLNRRIRTSMMDTINSWPHPDVTVNVTIPTLLDDHSLRFIVGKPKKPSHALLSTHIADSEGISTTKFPRLVRSYVFVNGQGTGPEAVARNGAVYVVGRLLHPYKPSHDMDGDGKEQDSRWDDWEEWLPAWGEQ